MQEGSDCWSLWALIWTTLKKSQRLDTLTTDTDVNLTKIQVFWVEEPSVFWFMSSESQPLNLNQLPHTCTKKAFREYVCTLACTFELCECERLFCTYLEWQMSPGCQTNLSQAELQGRGGAACLTSVRSSYHYWKLLHIRYLIWTWRAWNHQDKLHNP